MNAANPLSLSAVMPESHLTLFSGLDIQTPRDLRRAGSDANARARLAQQTGLPLGQIEAWVIQADLLELYTGQPEDLTPEEAQTLTSLGLDGLLGLRRLSDEGLAKLVARWASATGIKATDTNGIDLLTKRLTRFHTQARSYFETGQGHAIVTHPHNLLVVSDLHLGEGTSTPDGKLDRNEDFFYDDDFANLLLFQQQRRSAATGLGTAEDRPWRLLFNGDVVDFLQVTGVPAHNVTTLEQAVADQLGTDFLAGIYQPAPPASASDRLSRFFDRVNGTRKRLTLLRQALQQCDPAADQDPLAIRQLQAEADILIAAGDSRLDTNRLTDLEELLRIPSELDEMGRQLKKAGHTGQDAPLDLTDKDLLKTLRQQIQESQPGAPQLSRTAFAYLAQQIMAAWQLLANGNFSTDLLRLVIDLETVFVLHPVTDPLTAGVWKPRHMRRERSAFARYRDLLVRYRAVQDSLGDSLVDLAHPDLAQPARLAEAEQVGRQLRRAFETLFLQVPQWRVGDEEPYVLRYEAVRWGLGSSQPENVWRVYQIYRGHPVFFQAMAWFVACGNEIVIQTGNHDIELFWADVRSAMRNLLVLAYHQLNGPGWQALFAPYAASGAGEMVSQPTGVVMESLVKQRLSFTHWLYYEPGVAYIEHGCQYETANSWPTYLDPRYVGTVPDHQIRLENGVTLPGQVEQPALFWPWGSLIVRYIFNQIEQTHPFADQIKPITRYFTWAFSRDFLRSIGLLILSLPGLSRVVNQILDRGVVEGWFGPNYTLSGLANMVLRGASTWLTWLRRLLHLEWLTAPAARRRLRWPVLPWPAWEQIVALDEARRQTLARLLPDFYWRPRQIEEAVLVTTREGSPPSAAGQYGQRLWQRLLELALQISFLLLLLGGAGWLTGWQFLTHFGPLTAIGVPRRLECQLLALQPTAPETLLGFLQPWGLLMLLGVLPLGIYLRRLLTRPQLSRRQLLVPALAALAGIWLTIYLLTNLYCGFAYYQLPEPGPWSGLSAFPTWLVWVLLFLVATLLLRRRIDERLLRQKLRLLRQSQLFSRELALRRLVSGLLSLLGLAVLAFFFIYYGLPAEQYVQPALLGLLPWLSLVVWLTLASFWWGGTVLMLFFLGTASLGLMSLMAGLLRRLDIGLGDGGAIFWWLLLALLLGLAFYAWLPRWLSGRLLRAARYVGVVALCLLGLLWLLSWRSLFDGFYAVSHWESLLPLWLVWGFIGLWLLESKENPFPSTRFQGWLGDHLGVQWGWLRPIVDNTFTLIIEVGLLLLLLALLAQGYALRGRTPPGLLANFAGDRGQIIQLAAMILCLLVTGIAGRNLLSWLQTDDFPTRLANWRQRARWPLDLLVGATLLCLLASSLWLATGSSLLNETTTGLAAAVMLALLGLAGWFWSARESPPAANRIQSRLPYLLLGLIWLGFLLLWVVTLRALGQTNPPALGPGIRLAWAGLTVALVAAFIGLAYQPRSGRRGAVVLFAPELLQATAWGLLLLAGALATTVLVRAGLERPFPPLLNDDPALVEALNGLEDDVQAALFSLRLEQALRLSYDPAPLAQSAPAYLERLQASDARTGTYFATLLMQAEQLSQAQGAALASAQAVMTDPATPVPVETVAALIDTLQRTASPADGLAYPLLLTQTAALTDYFANHPTRDGTRLALTRAEVNLVNETLEMAALAHSWEQLTLAATEACLAGRGLSPDPDQPLAEIQPAMTDCARELVAIWETGYQAGAAPNSFVTRLNAQEADNDNALAAVSRRLATLDQLPAPGLWQQLNLLLWTALQNTAGGPGLTDPVQALNEDLDPGSLAAELSVLHTQRQEQQRALQVLHQFAKQQQSGDLYPNLFALGLLSVALAGIGGFLLLAWLSNLAQLPQPGLDSQKQIERIVAMGRRQQSGFVRKFTRTATVVLSFSFGAGLFIGAYLVISGLFTGDLFIALRSGAALTVISWIGRRAVLFIPASAGHGGGYLARAAAEIHAVLDRGDPAANALYPVPYYLFGHDHAAGYELLGRLPSKAPSAVNHLTGAWYVNTGAWVQAYTGEVRYRREDEEYSVFVEILPGPATTGRGQAPNLLRWDRTVSRPSLLYHMVEPVQESLPKRIVKTLLRWLGLRQAYTWPGG